MYVTKSIIGFVCNTVNRYYIHTNRTNNTPDYVFLYRLQICLYFM